MAVQYVVVQRGNPGDPSAAKKFYALAKSSGSLTLRQLAKQISDISTVSSVDTLAVLEAFLQLIPQHIADGKIVRMGEFGSFSLSVRSDGAENADAFNASLIKGNRLSFRPGAEFKKVLKTISYQKI